MVLTPDVAQGTKLTVQNLRFQRKSVYMLSHTKNIAFGEKRIYARAYMKPFTERGQRGVGCGLSFTLDRS